MSEFVRFVSGFVKFVSRFGKFSQKLFRIIAYICSAVYQ